MRFQGGLVAGLMVASLGFLLVVFISFLFLNHQKPKKEDQLPPEGVTRLLLENPWTVG